MVMLFTERTICAWGYSSLRPAGYLRLSLRLLSTFIDLEPGKVIYALVQSADRFYTLG
jgi:hypothetical protein